MANQIMNVESRHVLQTAGSGCPDEQQRRHPVSQGSRYVTVNAASEQRQKYMRNSNDEDRAHFPPPSRAPTIMKLAKAAAPPVRSMETAPYSRPLALESPPVNLCLATPNRSRMIPVIPQDCESGQDLASLCPLWWTTHPIQAFLDGVCQEIRG